jgi:ABC-type molybdate transport system substrate-binding protein
LLLALLLTLVPTMALADTVQLYAAGSLRDALTDVAKAFEAKTGDKVMAKFGASGLLKDEIAGGPAAQVLASANMEHPQALHDANKSGPVLRFARNKLCALVKPGMQVDSTSMLDVNVKLGTSTPKADPSGDYAFEVFRKAEAIKPGAQGKLEKKALQLTGSANSAAPPAVPSMAGMSRKGEQTSSVPIARMRWPRRSKTPASRSSRCRTNSASAPNTG